MCTLCGKWIYYRANLEAHYRSYHPAAFSESGNIIVQIGLDSARRSSKDGLYCMKFEGTSRLARVQGFIPAEPCLLVLQVADDPQPPKKHNVSYVQVRIIFHSAIFKDLQAVRTLEIVYSLYNKHKMNVSDWNPWNRFANTFNYQ